MTRHRDCLSQGELVPMKMPKGDKAKLVQRYCVFIIASSLNCFYIDRFLDSGGTMHVLSFMFAIIKKGEIVRLC